MSASLVGSEMCIRDRPPSAAGCLESWAAMLPQCSAKRLHRDARYAREAVSYTHLTLPTICSV
eukprot:4978887-Alexandrium_andersonii.AAC.1